ncbi:MAG TPA: class I SAM-dependent methyltransferase [Thermomicrobiaceae bacterium]|nr:class I SAM-dependent methyltransferase [Thermomicrobiaceae bacterium]
MSFPEHLFAAEPARGVLDRLRREDQRQRDAGLGVAERTRNATAPTGLFLYTTARATGARTIVEMGSSTGYSTIFLALAARENGGRVTGTEVLSERVQLANNNLRDAGLDKIATVQLADAARLAGDFAAGSVDLVFIDAEKDDYSRLFLAIVDRVRIGGLILTDNVVSHDCSDYLQMLAARSDIISQTLPFERGIELTLKR